jgi:hypothetical protein
MTMHTRRRWVVKGYDSTTQLFSLEVPASHFTNDGIEQAIRALTAMQGLTPAEVLSAYARRDRDSYSPVLEMNNGGNPYAIMCGNNPHIVASLIDDSIPAHRTREAD